MTVETHDVIVIGSGAAGMTAALRARDLGLDVLVIEKAHKYGGTSATSGGVAWIPNNGLDGTTDTREETLAYLDAVIGGQEIDRRRLEAYVDTGVEMLRYLAEQDIKFIPMPWPDYFAELPGARTDRSLVMPMWDGRHLGAKFPLVREQFARFKLFNRYAMNLEETFAIAARSTGWKRAVARVVRRYWTDLTTRRTTKRDRWFTSGAAIMGPLLARLDVRGVEIRLESCLERLLTTAGGVTGVTVRGHGLRYDVHARHGVVICAGGFEWNQTLRDRFYPVQTSIWWSGTPQAGNAGEALLAAEAVGAATAHTEEGWWIPAMTMPGAASNFDEVHLANFDVGKPHSVCINRNGDRFVNEACAYDRFGVAMVEDQKNTGANTPCWLVFDAQFRARYTAGGFLPSLVMPDRSIPIDWWDHYIYRSESIAGLAAKLQIDPAKLEDVVRRMNQYAADGEDTEFGRGGTIYDKAFGDPICKPNPALGPIRKPPYYAIPINLGDLGTKGGVRADHQARVLDLNGRPIAGLYAAGNATGSPFGLNYPGAGATIGPAMVFGYIAANAIAANARG